MIKNTSTIGVILFIITMIIFFVVYYFFGGINYYVVSLNVNSFLLPVLYCLTGFLSVMYLWKRKKLSFKEGFQRAFTPMLIGGFLSVTSIFLFLNYIDTDAKDLLNYQFVERNKKELTEIYTKEKSRLKSQKEITELDKDYQKSLKSFSPEIVKNKDMFTASHFFGYFAAILIFYIIISIFFGAFFRSKTSV